MTLDRQKLYVNLKSIEYSVEDQIFLKVSPWQKVLILGRKGKLSPTFIGPYKIIKRVDSITYQLKLPQELDLKHDVFNISMLRRY
ncbi:Chromo domain-containing protein [Gossypium australe]|uniref:Chromo domain-containing protein n=1 Tax=Gossypium australe TaxID=47621 RepID=A0A5B6WRJ5_9ROSI|nr:Chromo domain-containing protein [Gossypium australe]